MEIENLMFEVKDILNNDQLNIIYLISCIQDIKENKEGDEDDGTAIRIQYLKNIQKVMEQKEQYEICQKIEELIKK
ncbi:MULTISPECIES: hypothetical protein [Sphingobacterium]|uniref:hypothetical protein n=1 Tax=Sphingobacterium TaxID=28453 RepID=UPI0013DCA742|nr:MULTISPECIES: hypothetical protein [unclassified Sphingobacterium]